MTERTVKVDIDIPIAAPVSRLRALSNAVGDLTQRWERLGSGRAGTALQDGLTGVATAIGAVIAASVVLAAQFEVAMSRVKAATGASATELGQLRDAALDIGKQGKYSAVEAADAITELGKAGIKAADILGGALKGALDLAAAGELGIAKAAEIAASAMTQFKVPASQLPHIADLLAAAAGKAQGSVEDAGAALNQAGLVAAQAGLSIEETTAAIAAMASAGLMGSDAGTSLKTMLQRLVAPTQESAAIMRDLGIEAFDASGKFIGLANFAGSLRSALRGMTDQQRNAALSTIFGADAIRAASVVYEQGAEGVENWIDAVNSTGYASEQARVKTDNLVGDLTKLKGVITGTLVEAGGNASGGLRALTQGATALVEAFSMLPAPIAGTIVALTAITFAATLLIKAWTVLGPSLGAFRSGLATAGAEMLAFTLRSNAASLGFLRFTQAAGRAGAALRVLGAAAGIIGVVGLIAGSIIALSQSTDEAEQQIDGLADSLEHLGRTGKLSGAAAATFGANLETLKRQTKEFLAVINSQVGRSLDADWNTWMAGPGDSDDFEDSGAALRGLREAYAGLDAELASMVQGGNLPAAQAAFAEIKTAAVNAGVPVEKLNLLFPQFNQSVLDATNGVPGLAEGLGQYRSQMDLLGLSMAEVLATGRSVLDVFKELNGANLTQTRTLIAAKREWVDFQATLDENGKSFSANSEKGRENLSAILDLAEAWAAHAQAMRDNGATADEVAGWWAQQRDVLAQLLRDFGIAESEIQSLLDLYFKFPEGKMINFEARTGLAEHKAKALEDALNDIPSYKVSTVVVETVYRDLKEFSKRHGRADGGPVSGPGGPREDRIPMALSDGEYVINTAATSANRGLIELINASNGRDILAGIDAALTRQVPVPVPAPAPAAQPFDEYVLARVLRSAFAGMPIHMDGQRIGAIQGRTADLYFRAGG